MLISNNSRSKFSSLLAIAILVVSCRAHTAKNSLNIAAYSEDQRSFEEMAAQIEANSQATFPLAFMESYCNKSPNCEHYSFQPHELSDIFEELDTSMLPNDFELPVWLLNGPTTSSAFSLAQTNNTSGCVEGAAGHLLNMAILGENGGPVLVANKNGVRCDKIKAQKSSASEPLTTDPDPVFTILGKLFCKVIGC